MSATAGSIRKPEDLLTTSSATRHGFRNQANEKIKRADPFVAQARQLATNLERAKDARAAVGITKIREELVAAVGFSDKATSYFPASQLREALFTSLQQIEGEAGSGWPIMTTLEDKGFSPMPTYSPKNPTKIQRIAWAKRLLLSDKTATVVGKNIDIILLRRVQSKATDSELLSRKQAFIACGELKGGIDPAAADERWKTTKSALQTIRESFPQPGPKLFFTAAAIEKSMATEIFSQLRSGELAFAANLTDSGQVSELAQWLTAL